ncbi:Rgg/GadR/MutR family transcriptional regulator [Lactobacillus sp. LL6]|uniref:Rgg/GadR/MutR family transcriptional regulator n=1 Tax=Lactobacillus sp. LL6 TaxID=2596827 RepID=UPI001185B1D8|nr:Rgg/GadR/MutR family transcriptional regulator [Lactobacillus sp. LL6]TSO26944.1 helix-turn-helix domain-containing protein [Lactobacillus sp. LL6]
MYGEIYKKLRVQQNILQKNAAKNIVSVPLLSLWENGKSDITFEKFVKLIKRINLTPEEFFKLAKIATPSSVVKKIESLYMTKDNEGLETLTTKRIKLYQKRRSLDDLYLAVISCNYYYDLSGKNLLSSKYQEKLINKLSDVKLWTKKYISILGNSIVLLSDKNIYGLTSLLISNWSDIQVLDDINQDGVATYSIAFHTLLNALDILIVRKNYLYAEKLAIKIKDIPIKRDFLYIELRRQFLIELLNYKKDKNKDLSKLSELINIASSLNQRDTAFEFMDEIKRLENK